VRAQCVFTCAKMQTLSIDTEDEDIHVDDNELVEIQEPKPKQSRLRIWWNQLLRICGWRFIVFLFFSQCTGKGMLATIVRQSMLPLFRDKVDASTMQLYTMVVMMPWSLKPLIGLCSDYILIGGYRKRGWLIIALIVGILSCVALYMITLVVHREYWPAGVLVACFAGAQFQISLFDLLSEAKYSELRHEHPEVGSDISTLVQGMHDVGALLALLFVGLLADKGAFHVLFLVAFLLSIAPVLPTLLGWLQEERVVGAATTANWTRSELPFIGVVAFCGFSSVAVVALEETPLVGLGVAFALLLGCLLGSWWVFPPLITQIALFQVLTTIAQPSMSTALDYFYTANEACVADAPHFSYAYFIGYTGIVGTAISLLGVVVYQLALSKLRFRPVLLITTILVALAGLSDLSMVLRFNIKMGIPDSWAYMMGEAIIEPLLSKLSWIPVSALISMAATPGREACSFAFLAGISNFARMVSKLSGAILFEAAGLGSGCDFDALWWMVLLCHVVFPLAVGVPAVWIVPNARQDEKI